MSRFPARIAVALVALFLMAVPAQAEELALVRGSVTVDGEPLKQGMILFFTDDDHFTGAKIKDGKYPAIKLPAGACKVAIQGERVPRKFQSENSGLQAMVKLGENLFDFSLTK
jgi:hypothetical protein